MPGSGLHRRTDKTNCQPATRGVQGKALFKEYKEKFRTEHSTATVERNPQEKGKFRLCIDGIPILDWFRKKFQEIKEKLGLNTPVENKQRKGLKI